MKLAVITDSSAYLPTGFSENEGVFVLNIPIIFGEESFFEGENLSLEAFYQKMAASKDLPKTSQASLAQLDDLLTKLSDQGYTHVIGLFLAKGISGFWQNIQFLIEEHSDLAIAFPDTKITSAPLGSMVVNAWNWSKEGLSFELILERLDQQIAGTTAFIMVDDLNHLVKGGRLSNGSALLGNLLSIKPILYFDQEGKIIVFEKVRTEKKAMKRLAELVLDFQAKGNYDMCLLHANAQDKAKTFADLLAKEGGQVDWPIVPFSAVIAAHLGQGAVAFAITPAFE